MLYTISKGQAIDNTLSYRNVDADRNLRINYENDYFSAVDVYYTQGIHIELVSPAMARFPVSKLLWRPKNYLTRIGLALEHNAYTPTSIRHDYISYGDRPFCGTLSLKSFSISTDGSGKNRVTTAFSYGIIGAGAGAKEMQVYIHAHTNNQEPLGWQYQVHNDILLNYQLNYERNIIVTGHYFAVNADGQIRLGTTSDKAAIGTTLMAGYFNMPFNTGKHTKLQAYIYTHPELNLVGYDGTLQGGLFNRSSPYIINGKDIERVTYGYHAGIVLGYGAVLLEYFQGYISKEFATGTAHHWGGLQLAIHL
jgi:hypothetical protein